MREEIYHCDVCSEVITGTGGYLIKMLPLKRTGSETEMDVCNKCAAPFLGKLSDDLAGKYQERMGRKRHESG